MSRPASKAFMRALEKQRRVASGIEPRATWRLLFSAPMALAFIEGRKTVTRRTDRRLLKAQPGDLLLGKEAWGTISGLDAIAPSDMPTHAPVKTPVFYLADGHHPHAGKTRVSIHMPDWACRIRARIESVREEPLQDITDEDVKAEGLKCLSKDGGRTWKWGIPDRDGWPGGTDIGWEWTDWRVSPRAAYARLWDLINPNRPWASNPSVVRVEFAPLARGVRSAGVEAFEG